MPKIPVKFTCTENFMHKVLKTAVTITYRAGSRNQKNDFTFVSDVLQHNLSLLDKTQNKHSHNRFQL